MNWRINILIPPLFLAAAALASSPPEPAPPIQLKIHAVAKKADGSIGYTEEHEIKLNSAGEAMEARTEYFTPNNKLAAVLTSSFRISLSANDYTFRDLRDGSAHGAEVVKEGYLVWNQNKGEKKEERLFNRNEFEPNDLVVAGQGLFFHLQKNLKNYGPESSIPVKLLIPGRLDYFSFHLLVEKEDADTISFKMRPDSLFVRIFLSNLRFQFEKATGRIMAYEGPSNLVEGGGSIQNVKISYEFSPPSPKKQARANK